MVTWMDAFMKLENVGADLVVKTLGPLVAQTADHNFVECAGFFSQISQTARTNPEGLQRVAQRLPRVTPQVREEFIQTSQLVAQRYPDGLGAPVRRAKGTPASLRRPLDTDWEAMEIAQGDPEEIPPELKLEEFIPAKR